MKFDVLVFTCDKYSSLWKYFYKFYNENLPKQFVNSIYFLTDKQPKNTFGINPSYFIVSNSNSFFDRLEEYLERSYSDYFLLLLDDYFLSEQVSERFFQSLLSFVSASSADYIKLSITHRNTYYKRIFDNNKNIHLLKIDKAYSVDLYPSLWKKDFIKSIQNNWKSKYNSIWDFEGRINQVNSSNKCFIYTGKEFTFIDVIRKGKLRREAHKILSSKYKCDLSSDWTLMSKKESIKDRVIPFLSMYMPSFLKNIFKSVGRKKGKQYYSD